MKYRSDVSLTPVPLSFSHLSTKAQAVEIAVLKPLAEYTTTFPFMSHNAHTHTSDPFLPATCGASQTNTHFLLPLPLPSCTIV